MSLDDRDNGSRQDGAPEEPVTPKQGSEEIREALRSETDEPLPPVAEAIAERDAQRRHPITPQGRRRRFLNQRNLVIATIFAAAGVVALILLIFLAYKLGYTDRYVAGQIKETFAKYGIRAEIKEFHAGFHPTVSMSFVELTTRKPAKSWNDCRIVRLCALQIFILITT